MTTEEALEAYKRSAEAAVPGEEAKQTPEEQAEALRWLREHGIEVETPEDRKRAEVAGCMVDGYARNAPLSAILIPTITININNQTPATH